MAPAPLPPLRHDRARGIALRFGSVTLFAVMAALIKLALDRGANLPEVIFYRSLFALPPLFAWIAASGLWSAWRTTRPGAHLVRSVIGITGMILNFGSLALLPLAEATTILFAAPLMALALSSPLLGERVGAARWVAVLAGFAGMIVVVQPAGGSLPLVGTLVAISAAFAVACVTIMLRSISRTEGTPTVVLYFTLFCTIASALTLPWFGQWHDGIGWLLLVAIGTLGGLAQMCLTGSLRLAPIAVLAPIDYVQLLYAVVLGWLLWGTHPAPTTWVGAAVIIASVLVTLRIKPKDADIEAARPVVGES